MNIENDIFKRTKVLFNKLESYGFIKNNNKYIYEQPFLNNTFKAVITIDEKGSIKGKVIDLQMDDEYLALRTSMNGEFVEKVRDSYKDILRDIKANCYESRYFIYDQTNRINNLIKIEFNDEPEFLWDKTPGCGVYRNKDNNKWYGIIMNIDYSKIDNKTGEIEIMNVKLDEDKIKELIKHKGYYKAYHMNKKYWITILLDETLSDDEILDKIEKSYHNIK